MNKHYLFTNNKYFYGILVVLITLGIQMIIYKGTNLITNHLQAYDFTISFIDDKIPFVPFFIIIYVGAYLWWYLEPLLYVKHNKELFDSFTIASIIGFLICGVIFVVIPTTITRPVITENDIFSRLVKFIYSTDTPERAINLFPSMHCFLSFLHMIYVFKLRDKLPLIYRLFAYIFGLLVCLSTVFVKQHYSIDIVGGLVVAFIAYFICERFKLYKLIGGKNNDHQAL